MDFCRPTFTRRATLYSIVFIVLIVISCAEVGPPPGGPEDKSTPYIISSTPLSGATSVTPGNTITIQFSERIVKPEGKRVVFISPRPTLEPRLQWKSDRLVITLADSFKVDQTYIVSLSTDIVDLRRNRLDKATTIAFSTGSSIDSGRVSGMVYSADKAAQGILVGLYDSAQLSGDSPIDSVYAHYLTQTGAGGSFSFDYLPSREFRLIAFEDRNRDERFSLEREQFAVPDRVVQVGGRVSLDSLRITLTSQPTSGLKIASASYASDRMIRVRLSSAVNLERLISAPGAITVRSVLDTAVAKSGVAVVADGPLVGSEFAVYAGELAEGMYSLEMVYQKDSALRFDSLSVKPREDKEPPQMIFLPDSRPQFLEQLKMTATFSEPVDTGKMSEHTFQFFDQDEKQLGLEAVWVDPLRIVFASDDIRAGASYRFKVTEFEIADYSGNTLGDSLREFAITTLDPDSLGTVAGNIEVKLADRQAAPVVVQFVKLDNRQTFDLFISGREFKVDLPAGKYLANGYIDIDSSGTRGLGSIIPYRYSETVMTHPDTIAVRARFETSGIRFEFK